MDTWLYVMANDYMPGLVKIGWSTDVSARAAQLSSASGVPGPFKIIAQVLIPNAWEAEAAIHLQLALYRVNPSREFFRATPESAAAVIRDAASKAGDAMEDIAGAIADFVPEAKLSDIGAALALLGLKEVASRIQALTGSVFDKGEFGKAA